MTPRPTKRELAARIDALSRERNKTAADIRIEITDHLVMTRHHAERDGRAILGPAADTPPDADAVRVAPDREGFD